MNAGFFSNEFITTLPADDAAALGLLGREYLRFQQSFPPANVNNYASYLECLGLLKAFHTSRGLHWDTPAIGPNQRQNMDTLGGFLTQSSNKWISHLETRNAETIVSETEQRYVSFFASEEPYEFSDAEFARIQTLITELREFIARSHLITPKHKRRLSKRLEATQRELHKKTTDIEDFWAFIAEAGIVARKFGEDLKPITERVTALAKIVGAAIMAKEGIGHLPDMTKKALSDQQANE
ncbi:MAG TPA: hypothetical protein VFB72_08920 [Verrucomicrobiae bacterium]|nr:hypothetical protein [Verrucomicrobiae bacterium]